MRLLLHRWVATPNVPCKAPRGDSASGKKRKSTTTEPVPAKATERRRSASRRGGLCLSELQHVAADRRAYRTNGRPVAHRSLPSVQPPSWHGSAGQPGNTSGASPAITSGSLDPGGEVPGRRQAVPRGSCVRSSAERSQRPRSAAASYVVCRNVSNAWSGEAAERTASYGSTHSRNPSL